MRRRVAQLRIVFEHMEPARRHLAARGGAVVLEHLTSACQNSVQIVLGKAGLFGQEGRHKAVRPVKAVGHGVLAAHGAVVAFLLFGFGFGGDGHARDGMLRGDDGIDRTREGELHGPRTWPQLTPVDMTAPKVRTSKKLRHIQARVIHGIAALALLVVAGEQVSRPMPT
jgi:hypothetical protein